jgi:hypothetical protein
LFIPDPNADFLPSRIQGTKRHPNPDPEPQQWIFVFSMKKNNPKFV